MPTCTICNDLDLRAVNYIPGPTTQRGFGGTLREVHESSDMGCHSCSILYQGVAHFAKLFKKTNEELVEVRDASPFFFGPASIAVVFNDSDSYLINIEFYQEEGSQAIWPDIHIARHVAQDSSSSTTFDLAERWLKNCMEKHPKCSSPTASRLPTRILDVNLPVVKLREMKQESAPYLTLSHCWGKSQIITTTKSTLESRKEGIPWRSLSRTFQDAITITRKLGFRYLWVDSLCIIQDDTHDWERESSEMASIYAGSKLTIAATSGTDGDSGCFVSRLKNISEPERPKDRENSKPKLPPSIDPVLHQHFPIDGHLINGTSFQINVRLALDHSAFTPGASLDSLELQDLGVPLLARAWVMQERLLSPRTLHFTRSELIWECNMCLCCECSFFERDGTAKTLKTTDGSSIPDDSNTGLSWRLKHSSTWERLVEQFTQLDLTYPSDCLPALSGIAHKECESSSHKGAYVAGFWAEEMHRGLLWRIKMDLGGYYEFPITRNRRPDEYRAPSWAWPSVQGSLEFPVAISAQYGGYDFGLRFVAHIDDLACNPAGHDPMGSISSGYMKISGLVIHAEATPNIIQSGDSPANVSVCALRVGDLKQMFVLDAQVQKEEPEVTPGEIVTCLLLAIYGNDMWILVLRPLKQTVGTFTRIGLISPERKGQSRNTEVLESEGSNFSNDVMKFLKHAHEESLVIV